MRANVSFKKYFTVNLRILLSIQKKHFNWEKKIREKKRHKNVQSNKACVETFLGVRQPVTTALLWWKDPIRLNKVLTDIHTGQFQHTRSLLATLAEMSRSALCIPHTEDNENVSPASA